MQADEEIVEHFLRVSRIAFGLPIAATKQRGRESNSADWFAATLSSAEFSFGKGLMSTSRHEFNLNEAQRTKVSSIYYQRMHETDCSSVAVESTLAPMIESPAIARVQSSARNRLSTRQIQLGKIIPGLLMAILLAAGGAGYWWWKTNAAPASEDAARKGGASGDAQGGRRFAGAKGAQPVSVQAARRQDIGVTVNAIGAIAAWNTATVHAQVSGVLQKLNFTEGRQVKAGEVLALIDPRAFEASLGQADGALSRDKAQLDNARVDLKRYQDLFARDAVARQQLDTQEALVRQLEGTVKLDQSAVDTARLQLSYTRVSAPIAGKAGLKQVDLGNVVQPTDINGIVIITQTRPIALVFSVPAGNLPQITARLKTGKPLPVEAWDRSGAVRLAAGRVATVDNAIDASTDTIRIKAMFENADDALYPNQAVSVRLRLDTLVGAIAVPQAAVQRGAQGFYVYVVDSGNLVSPRVVVPGAVDGEWMAVTGQLQPGETVVIDGVDRLRDGARVEVIAADPKAGAGANASRGAGPRPGSTAKGEPDKPEGKAQRGRDLPPDVAEKVKLMSPDERRAWFGKQRETQTEPGAPH